MTYLLTYSRGPHLLNAEAEVLVFGCNLPLFAFNSIDVERKDQRRDQKQTPKHLRRLLTTFNAEIQQRKTPFTTTITATTTTIFSAHRSTIPYMRQTTPTAPTNDNHWRRRGHATRATTVHAAIPIDFIWHCARFCDSHKF